jgi:hypothetical protein
LRYLPGHSPRCQLIAGFCESYPASRWTLISTGSGPEFTALLEYSLIGALVIRHTRVLRWLLRAGHYLPEERPGIVAAAIRETANR